MLKKKNLTFNFNLPEMSDEQFMTFSGLVYSVCGINLPLKKKIMLTSRLRKRLTNLDYSTFEEYYNYLSTSTEGRAEEIIKMIDEVSTNKTDFYRERGHFEYLVNHVLPEFLERKNHYAKMNIWSAGCSTGEEPCTIAIVLNEFFRKHMAKIDFKIHATDISTKVLKIASQGTYQEDKINSIPEVLIRKYFTQGKGNFDGEYRITPELRKYIFFSRFNLMEESFESKPQMDIIFCRNVIIYFDKKTQKELFNKFYKSLKTGGYLFIGNSETLYGVNDKFVSVNPTIYTKME